jgi:hypothetical protein
MFMMVVVVVVVSVSLLNLTYVTVEASHIQTDARI